MLAWGFRKRDRSTRPLDDAYMHIKNSHTGWLVRSEVEQTDPWQRASNLPYYPPEPGAQRDS